MFVWFVISGHFILSGCSDLVDETQNVLFRSGASETFVEKTTTTLELQGLGNNHVLFKYVFGHLFES